MAFHFHFPVTQLQQLQLLRVLALATTRWKPGWQHCSNGGGLVIVRLNGNIIMSFRNSIHFHGEICFYISNKMKSFFLELFENVETREERNWNTSPRRRFCVNTKIAFSSTSRLCVVNFAKPSTSLLMNELVF